MVKSGLVNDITVSHYRLSLHLITAFLIISTIFWLIMNISLRKNKSFFKVTNINLPFQIFIILIFLQIIIGAFVSGLDAGQIYQSWPLMGNTYIPNDFLFEKFNDIIDFGNQSLVQFYHRNLAYIIFLYFLFLIFFIYKKKLFHLINPLKILSLFLILQILLGIFTLVSGLNIYLASMHQIISVLLVISALNLHFLSTK
jgi:cytochrome c oxidase assembly protein subunit 15